MAFPSWLFLCSLLSVVHSIPASSGQYELDNRASVLIKRHEDATLADLGLSVLRRRHLEKRGIRVAFNRAVAFAPPTPDLTSNNILELEGVPGTPLSQRYLSLLDDTAVPAPFESGAKVEEIKNVRDSVYLTTMTFGNEKLTLVIDTGSADTWVAEDKFSCLSVLTRQPIRAEQCRFNKKTYVPTKTFKKVDNQHFNISYADGEFLRGRMGKEEITFAGIKVVDQEFGLVDVAAWNGDTFSSGLTGLAFPNVTRAFPGESLDNPTGKKLENIPYDPLFTSMWKKNLVAPHFSVALNRASEKPGVIALGGLPGPEFKFENVWAKAPLQHLSLSNPSAKAAKDYQLYVVQATGFNIIPTANNSQNAANIAKVATAKTNVVIDTGTTLSYLPPAITEAINKAWDPPANIDPITRQWLVKCNAKAPKVAMKLDGKNLYFDSSDMLLKTSSGQVCLSGVQATRSVLQPSVLGGTFLKSIVAVFDIGAAEMRFANRIR